MAAQLFCILTRLLAAFRMTVMILDVFSCSSQSVWRTMSHLMCSWACCPAPLVIICLCITEGHLQGFTSCCTGCARPFHKNLSSEHMNKHCSRGISPFIAVHGGMSIEGIFTEASWSSPCSFIDFYLQDASHLSVTHSVHFSEWVSEWVSTLHTLLDKWT